MGTASQSSEESPTSCDGTQKVQVLALARAVANSSPNPYDKDALKFNVRTTLETIVSFEMTEPVFCVYRLER